LNRPRLAPQVLPGGLLILWQIGFQLLYGLLDEQIASDLGLSIGQQALLGLAFLLPYAAMQWGAGRLIDRWGARRLLAFAALGCAVGAHLFAVAHSLPQAITGRMTTGVAAAFGFPAVAQLLRHSCTTRRFSLAMALVESCIGFGAAAVALLVLWQAHWSWRLVSRVETLLVLSLALWMLPRCLRAWRQPAPIAISDNPTQPAQALAPTTWSVVMAAAGVYAWEAGLVFAFGGFWSLWLLRQQLVSPQQVTLSSLVLSLAVGFGTAAAGVLAQNRPQRCRWMLAGTSVGGLALVLLLVLPVGQHGHWHLLLMLALGLCTAVGGLAFGEAGLAAPKQRVGQVIGLVNGIGCLAGGLFHVLPADLMLVPGLQTNLVLWFGGLALLGWMSALHLWRVSQDNAGLA
jgi:predicted MFS family arabinose efflux permease